MSKHSKSMICLPHPWEAAEYDTNKVEPDCRNHRHWSKRRAFERTNNVMYANRILAEVVQRDKDIEAVGFIVESGGRARWTPVTSAWGCPDTISPEAITKLLSYFQRTLDEVEQTSYIVRIVLEDEDGMALLTQIQETSK